jgi:TonB family protein
MLPLISLPFYSPINDGSPVPVFILSEITISAEKELTASPWGLINWYHWIYFAVSLLFLSVLCISLVSILFKTKSSKTQMTKYGKVFIDAKTKSPYSFFSWVFFLDVRFDLPMSDILLRHEFSHVKYRHSIDRLLSSLFKSFFWFSPFVHLHHRLLSEVHEFQADALVIRLTENKETYQNIMLAYAGIPIQFPISNSFSSHLKKRIAMINHKQQKIKLLPLIGSLLLLVAFTMLTSMVQIRTDKAAASDLFNAAAVLTGLADQTDQMSQSMLQTISVEKDTLRSQPQSKTATATDDRSTTDEVFVIVEKMPEFPGGKEALYNYLAAQLSDWTVKEAGRVFISFIVETDGSLSDIEVLRGINSRADNKAVEVIANMPKWNPGEQRGQAVRVRYNIPFHFTEETDIKSDKKPVNTVNTIQTADGKTVYTLVDEIPEFPGGKETLTSYLQNQTYYTKEAEEKGIEGTVFISFIIETDGSTSNIIVLRGIHPELDEIATEVIRNMPSWKPGKKEGVNVPVQFNIPVKFTLHND